MGYILDNGKENGNYYLGFRVWGISSPLSDRIWDILGSYYGYGQIHIYSRGTICKKGCDMKDLGLRNWES